MPTPPRPGERLHKHLADLGVESRRTIERWIEQGKISVDGRTARLGDKVGPGSRITLDGRPVRATPAARRRVIVYHKPEGEISTRKDPDNRPTIFRRLPTLEGGRWVAVGRLDIDTRGLLLFTNDGQLANRLMHPSAGVEREYLCRVYGTVGAAARKRLLKGIRLDGEPARFRRLRRQPGREDAGRNNWYSVVVTEGKYREVRRMWEAVGCRLSRLIRVRYGPVRLPKTLKPGQWRELQPAAIAELSTAGNPSAGRRTSNPRSSGATPQEPRKAAK